MPVEVEHRSDDLHAEPPRESKGEFSGDAREGLREFFEQQAQHAIVRSVSGEER